MRYVFPCQLTNYVLSVDSETENPVLVLTDIRDGSVIHMKFESIAQERSRWISKCFGDVDFSCVMTAEDIDEIARWAVMPSSDFYDSQINWHYAEKMAYLVRK